MSEKIEDNKLVELNYKVLDEKTGQVLSTVEFPLSYVHGVDRTLSTLVLVELEGKSASLSMKPMIVLARSRLVADCRTRVLGMDARVALELTRLAVGGAMKPLHSSFSTLQLLPGNVPDSEHRFVVQGTLLTSIDRLFIDQGSRPQTLACFISLT